MQSILTAISRTIGRIAVWILLTVIAIFIRALDHSGNAMSWFRRATIIHDPSEFGLSYSSVAFPSRDGLTLRGWWFEASSRRPVIILLHGIQANRAEPPQRVFGIAKELIKSGYNILAFDFRAHGESEGKYISAGYREKNDLLGAIDYLRRIGVNGKIGVLGFSMGAAISLMTAAECKEIGAVVADSSFTDIISLIKGRLPNKYFRGFIIPAFISAIKVLYNIDFTRIRPVEAARLISVPVFIIHGGRDKIIPVEHAYRLTKACQNFHKKIWVVPEAQHTYAYFARPEEYILRVLSFFKEAFSEPSVGT